MHASQDQAAPGLGAGRGSQHGSSRDIQVGVRRCARPWCWARIATPQPMRWRPVWRQRAAPGLGAGRGSQRCHPRQPAMPGVQAAPGLGAGRGSQRVGDGGVGDRARLRPALVLGEDRNRTLVDGMPGGMSGLRPALVLGEDRNMKSQTCAQMSLKAAPGLGAGRGSQRLHLCEGRAQAAAAPGLGAGRGSQHFD